MRPPLTPMPGAANLRGWDAARVASFFEERVSVAGGQSDVPAVVQALGLSFGPRERAMWRLNGSRLLLAESVMDAANGTGLPTDWQDIAVEILTPLWEVGFEERARKRRRLGGSGWKSWSKTQTFAHFANMVRTGTGGAHAQRVKAMAEGLGLRLGGGMLQAFS